MSGHDNDLSPRTGDTLLAIARDSITLALDNQPLPVVDEPPDPVLTSQCGAFVTLKRSGHLRGCIGRVESDWPLWETVARMARAAAFEDPRFDALEAHELDDLNIEVSVMTPLERMEDPEKIIPGVHGVMVERGFQRGLFLPQVAEEQGWDRVTLLDQVCLKAGLPTGAWREPDTSLFVFEARIASE